MHGVAAAWLGSSCSLLFRRCCRGGSDVFAYTSIPTFKEAYKVLFKEKRLGVDVLDSIVVVG